MRKPRKGVALAGLLALAATAVLTGCGGDDEAQPMAP
jgi:hypothetical protein